MKVIHLIGGGDVGGAKVHVLTLIKELGKYIEVKLISLRPGQFADDAKAMGIDVEVVFTGSFFRDIKNLADIILKGKYDIIHSHGAKANMYSIAVRKTVKLPTVSTVHSDYKLDYMHSIAKTITFGYINAIALRSIDYYIGVSRNFKDMLIDRNFKAHNIFTLYNGMDFSNPPNHYSREALCKKYNISIDKDDVIVGIAARLYPVKGLDTLIKAAKIVCEKNPCVKFIIGGDGEDRKHLEGLTASLGISNKIYFLGWLDDPYELMSNVDISVLTSISESFPYSILEGAKFKKATVSSNVGGIPDLIENGKNGYLFEPGDYNKLSKYILDLAESVDKRKTMGEMIYQKASTNFSLSSRCKKQLEIYDLIQERSIKKSESYYKYDVIISGYYGFKNIGDEAMLRAIIDNLKSMKKDIRIIVLSKNPTETSKSLGVDSISRENLLHIFIAMKKAKLFIYGGGNLIQDNTSSRSLMYYLGTIWMARLMKLKVMFYAHGFGPLNKTSNIKLTRNIINHVDVITLRELLSLEELKRLNITKPRIELTADAALAYKIPENLDAEGVFLNEDIDPKGTFVGFSVRKCPGNNKIINDNMEKVIAQTADYMQETYGVKPLFIPMQYPVDFTITESVLSKMKTKGYTIKNKYSTEDTFAILSRMDILIGMRLHALIFASSLSIPIIGIEYDPKIKGFLDYTGQLSAGNVSNLNFEDLKNAADKVWNNRVSIKENLPASMAVYKNKAFENAKIAMELIESVENFNKAKR